MTIADKECDKLPPIPSGTSADDAHTIIRAAVAAIPGVGGSITELIGLWYVPPLERRRDEWLNDLASALSRLIDEFSDLKKQLAQPAPELVSVFAMATRAAIATHEKEKLAALRAAVLNTACGAISSDSDPMVLMNVLDSLTEEHIVRLKYWQHMPLRKVVVKEGESRWREATHSDVRGIVLADLVGRGLMSETILETDLGGIGIGDKSSTTYSYKVTRAGTRLLNFIRQPKTGEDTNISDAERR